MATQKKGQNSQEKIHEILWYDVASGDVPVLFRDLVQEFVDSGFDDIVKKIKREIRNIKLD